MHVQRGREECVINPSRSLESIPVTPSENKEKKIKWWYRLTYPGNAARTCHSCQYRGKLVYLANAFPSQKTEAKWCHQESFRSSLPRLLSHSASPGNHGSEEQIIDWFYGGSVNNRALWWTGFWEVHHISATIDSWQFALATFEVAHNRTGRRDQFCAEVHYATIFGMLSFLL